MLPLAELVAGLSRSVQGYSREHDMLCFVMRPPTLNPVDTSCAECNSSTLASSFLIRLLLWTIFVNVYSVLLVVGAHQLVTQTHR